MVSSRPEAAARASDARDPGRVAEVVLAAAALDPAERSAFLRRVTLTEPAMLAEVRRRLELAARLPESFLAVPAAELLEAADRALEPAEDGEEAPREAGPRYEPEELVGEGGMARVYRAFDRQLERPVALKLLDRAEPEARRRFLREAQAQARVRHPHVLEVYETGLLGERPFIAMRWVEGPTLLAVRGETSLEEKVRLLALVAEGLHAAHREGLIHRDVKPSNVLVERTPEGAWKPWIADFGIAAWSDGEGAGELAGTPAYLAPELLRDPGAPADRRADVYGLGVTLYEFLTGEAPFRADELAELLRQVRDDAPRPPRELVPALPADLQAVVLKCLEKDPEARYPSARALADDLWRFLDGEVVEARAATVTYRLTRFALRHRRLLTVAGAAAVLLAAALVVAAVLGVEARVANRRVELRQAQAEDLIGFMLGDLRGRLEPLGKLEILDGVGERAMTYFAAVPEGELSDEELARRSQALYQIGDVRIRQGRLSQALAPLQESLALARELAARNPGNAERLFGLGQSHFWVGYVQWEQGALAAARPHFEAYRDLSERLVRRAPERPEYRMELAYAHSNLGSLARQAADPAAALESFGRSLALKEELVRGDPGNPDFRFELAATHDLMGHTAMELGRLDEALPHFEAGLSLRRDLVAEAPETARFQDYLGTSHDSLAHWLEARGRLHEALAHVRASGEIFSALADHDPENQRWRWKLELSRRKEGRLRALSGEDREGRALLAEVAATAARHAEREPADRRWRSLMAWARIDLGGALLSAGEEAAARAHAAKAVELLEGLLETEPRDRDALRWLGRGLVLLGRAEERLDEPARAAAAWERARRLLEPAVRSSADPEILAPWAAALVLLGRPDEARPTLAALDASGYRPPELAALRRAPRPDAKTPRPIARGETR